MSICRSLSSCKPPRRHCAKSSDYRSLDSTLSCQVDSSLSVCLVLRFRSNEGVVHDRYQYLFSEAYGDRRQLLPLVQRSGGFSAAIAPLPALARLPLIVYLMPRRHQFFLTCRASHTTTSPSLFSIVSSLLFCKIYLQCPSVLYGERVKGCRWM